MSYNIKNKRISFRQIRHNIIVEPSLNLFLKQYRTFYTIKYYNTFGGEQAGAVRTYNNNKLMLCNCCNSIKLLL